MRLKDPFRERIDFNYFMKHCCEEEKTLEAKILSEKRHATYLLITKNEAFVGRTINACEIVSKQPSSTS